MATTPRIRTELQATPAEEQGIKYFDVSDPKSGHKMRLYDFEWLVAQRMDGARPYDEVAGWAKDRLGIHPSGGDLAEFATKLRDYGFFEPEHDDFTPLPAALPAESQGGNGESKAARIAEEVQFEEEQPTLPRVDSAAEKRTPLVEVAPQIAPQPARHPFAPREESVMAPVPRQPPKKSNTGAIVGAVIVGLLLAGFVGYFQFIAPNAAVHVSVVLVSPREVVRLYDGAAPVKKAEPQTLSFGDAGKVTDIVAKDTDVKAGMPLATLDGYGKVEKELADVKDRAGFYEKQLAAAKAKNDAEAVKTAESKVAEKHKLMSELETKAGKVRILSPGSGTVSDVLVATGDDVKAGSAAVKIADKRMTVDFTLSAADAATMKAGAPVQMTPASSPATIAGRVGKVEGGTLTVELLADSTAKPGDSLRLVKSKLENVVPVPDAAVVKRDGVDTVFVLTNGEAKARKVNVVDHDGTNALVQTGLATGDSVIVTGVETLVDGKKATTQQ